MDNLPSNKLCVNDKEKIKDIIACFCQIKQTIASVKECLDLCYYNSNTKERILFCILLSEIRTLENIVKNEISEIYQINETVNNENFGLKEIKSEIIQINEIVTNINNILSPPGTLTTGPVVKAPDINNLLVKVLNKSPHNQTVRIKVFNLEEFPKCSNEIFNKSLGPIPPKCTFDTGNIEIDGAINEYEIEVTGVVPGVYLWSSAFPGTDPKNSAPINTFKHSDFVAQVYNNC